MSRLIKLFGWKPFSEESKNALEKFKRAVIIFPHSSAWDQTISYVYARSDPNFQAISDRFKLIVTMNVKMYEDFARRLFFNNMIFLKKNGDNYTQILEELEKTPEWYLALSPKGSIYKREWKTGWYNIAKHFDVPIIVMGADFDKHELRVVGEPIYINGRSYEEVQADALNLFGEVITLYSDVEYNLKERPHNQRFVVPEETRMFYTIIGIFVLLFLFLFLIRNDIFNAGKDFYVYWHRPNENTANDKTDIDPVSDIAYSHVRGWRNFFG